MKDVRIYYEDSIYTGPPEGIPSPVGVAAVVTRCTKNTKNEVGRYVLCYGEYYVYEDGQWFCLYTDVDLIDHILWKKPEIVLKGRWIPDNVFEDILDDTVKFQNPDKPWPEKTGWKKNREGHLRTKDKSWANL